MRFEEEQRTFDRNGGVYEADEGGGDANKIGGASVGSASIPSNVGTQPAHGN